MKAYVSSYSCHHLNPDSLSADFTFTWDSNCSVDFGSWKGNGKKEEEKADKPTAAQKKMDAAWAKKQKGNKASAGGLGGMKAMATKKFAMKVMAIKKSTTKAMAMKKSAPKKTMAFLQREKKK